MASEFQLDYFPAQSPWDWPPSPVWLVRVSPDASWALLTEKEDVRQAHEAGWEGATYLISSAGTADQRMRNVWDWIHEDGAGREAVLEELCPGWSIVSSKIPSERALMVAFDKLVEERNGD